MSTDGHFLAKKCMSKHLFGRSFAISPHPSMTTVTTVTVERCDGATVHRKQVDSCHAKH